jgi:hypothetical protein
VAVTFALLRGVAWYQYDAVTFDSAVYFEMAALIRNGQWSDALGYDYPPAYPVLIALFQSLVGSAETAGLVVAFLSDLLLLWPMLAIARRAVGEEAAWCAAFLWAVHLSAVWFGSHALSDAPAALWVATALAVGLRAAEERRLAWALAAGAASGVAFLFRPEGLEAALALAVFYAFVAQSAKRIAHGGQREAQDGRRSAFSAQFSALAAWRIGQSGRAMRRLGWVLAPLLGWVIVAGPYVAYISEEAHALTLSKKKSAAGFVRSAVPLAIPAIPVPPAIGPTQEKTTPPPERNRVYGWMHSLYVFQKPLVNGLTVVIIVPACIGLIDVLARRREMWNRTLGLLVGLFVFHVGIVVGLAADKGAAYLGRHHFLLAVVYALPVAGRGLAWVLDRMGRGRRVRRGAPAMACSIIVIASGVALVAHGPDQGRSLRTAGAWIRTQVSGTPVIVTRLTKLTYHAGAERVDIAGTYDEILQRARDRSAHFVALYPNLIGQTSPDFLARVNSTDLELVKVFPEPSPTAPEQRLELYRLRPAGREAGS